MKLEGWQNPSQKSKVKARSTERAEGKEGERCIERKSDTKFCSCTWRQVLQVAHNNWQENTSVNLSQCCIAWIMILFWINLTELPAYVYVCDKNILNEIKSHFKFFFPMHKGINARKIHQKRPQTQKFWFTKIPLTHICLKLPGLWSFRGKQKNKWKN